jgi:hypothetical protein
LQSCQVRAALVDDDLFGPAIVLNRAGEESAGRGLIAVLSSMKSRVLPNLSTALPIPMKPPLCSEMMSPPDSGMISPP